MMRPHARDDRGQSLVEFSLALTVFLVLMMGVFDFGRAIYEYNGVAQAAREIARATAAHSGTDFTTDAGRSPQTKAVIATQSGLIPGLEVRKIQCVDITGAPIATHCLEGNWIQVEIHAPYKPITPILGLALSGWDLFSSSTSVQLQ